jgi:molybdopterin-guanine dinucleotide biosynthesis adapter protein
LKQPAAPTLAIIGYSDSGKTTLCEAIAREAASSGIRLGYVKHTHHDEIGVPPNDTSRLLMAGAAAALLLFGDRMAGDRMQSGSRTAAPIDLQRFVEEHSADALLIEGWKEEGDWPRIALLRGTADVDLLSRPRIVATVSPTQASVGKRFAPDEQQAVVEFALTILRR